MIDNFFQELPHRTSKELKRLALEMKNRYDVSKMSVVFSTYHSIKVISESQKNYHLTFP